ncbi:hypothetical protein B0H14DRAFT_2881325 [Mycena olivaceomarginata]|nr:hypothetical protein B0H14DRAFT_2881325 [Mycena olivaceomarginata]
MPAIHTPSPMLSPSYNGSSPALDQYRRSPTPSSASAFGFSPATSKYLLHVIPPIHLPHDSDSFDSDLTPPPSTASGYHTQFRRGTLVPVHSTFQSQLGAIAKEYALPSTAGLILYLVSQPRNNSSPPPSEKSFANEFDEPGPRLSEDIWRHLWTRVVKSEIRDEVSSSLAAPPLLGLALNNRSTPYLPQAHQAYPLPLLSTNTGALSLHAPFTPSPTTPSSTSELPARFHTKSAPPSSSSAPSRSPSEAETPDTSQAAPSSRADSLDLPGLHADALIPILAKVEFDIDRRKAAWYEPWLRSRRMNHAKRKNSATPNGEDEERRAPLAFRLGGEKGRDKLELGRSGSKRYLPLSESPQSMMESEESGSEFEEEDVDVAEDDVEEDEAGKDPLADVFGEDADTWADMRASLSHLPSRPTNPHIVQLALSAGELANDHADFAESASDGSDEEDVREVESLVGNGRPALGVEIPGMQGSASRKRAPPPTPLVLSPAPAVPAPVVPLHLIPIRKTETRRFDMDDDDPNDRRKSQVIMRAQLDEIEKNLAQFSPRILRTDLSPSFSTAASSPNMSPPASAQYAPMPSSPFTPVSNREVFPPTPRLPNHPGMGDEDNSDYSDNDLSQQAAWPAVPYTSLTDRPTNSPAVGQQHFPPQLAVNGRASASAIWPRTTPLTPPAAIGPKSSLNSPLIPLSPDPFGRVPSQAPEVPSAIPGAGLGVGGKRTSKSYWESPVVVPAPALPEVKRKNSDSSIGGGAGDARASVLSKAATTATATTGSSRFSTDSMNGVGGGEKQANRATLMSVKGIKNLWRKSRKESVSIPPMTAVHENAWSPLSPPLPTQQRPGNPAVPNMTPTSPNIPNMNPPLAPPAPQRPNRPSMEDMDLPDVEVEMPPRTPLSAGFPGRLPPPPQPNTRPNASPRPSFSQERRPSTSTTSSQERRPSVDMLGAMGPGQERRPSVSQERRPSIGAMGQERRPERRPSQDMLGPPSRRASPEGMPVHQHGMPPHRPSPEQVPPLPQHMPRRPSDAPSHMSVQSHMNMQSGLSAPPPMLQSTKNSPIIPKAGPPRNARNDGLLWDQESPYPTRITPPARAPRPPSRAPSPTSVHHSSPPLNTSPPSNSQPLNTSPPIPPHPSPPMPEKDHRNSVRKSILKWKSQTNGNGGGAVPAPLTPSATTFRTRKTSLTGSPSQGSPLNLPLDIPPSPKIPEQFIASYVGSHPPPTTRSNSAAIARRRLSAKMVSTSTDSGSSGRQSQQHHRPRESTASSAHSMDTHESTSLDTSGFEIVSPRMGGALSFPYTELDHDRPFVDGVRM